MAETRERFEDVSTVISLLPTALDEHKPGLIPASYVIQAVKNPLKECKTLLIRRASFPVYIDENRPALIVPEPSDRVAEAICRDYKISVSHYEPNVSEPGLLWVSGRVDEKSIRDEIANDGILKAVEKQRALQMEWFRRLVSAADDDWEKHHMRRMISDTQRYAAEVLGLERPWNMTSELREAASLCKFCYSKVDPMAIVCGSCQGILDMKRYEKEFVKVTTKA